MQLNIFNFKRKIYIIALTGFIFAILTYQYAFFVAPRFAYMGFTYDLNFIKFAETLVILLIILLTIPIKVKKPSDFYMVYMFFLALLPFLVIYPLANNDRMTFYIVISNYFIIQFFRYGKPFKVGVFRNSILVINNLILGFVILISIMLLVKVGLPNLNFDITRVYEFRQKNSEILRIGFLSYVITWIVKVFLPYLLVISFEYKKYLKSLMVLIFFFLFFALLSQRSIIFYPFIVLSIHYFYKKTNSILLIPFGIATIIILLSIIALFLDAFYVDSLFYRRVFFLPSLLTNEYIEFFYKHDYVLWSNSITRYIIDYPYKLQPPELIANELGRESHANTSFLATGYMHFGIVGTFFYAMIVGLTFKFMDSIIRNRANIALTLAISFIPFHSLIFSADLPTALLTHGILISLMMLLFVRSKNFNGNNSKK